MSAINTGNIGHKDCGTKDLFGGLSKFPPRQKRSPEEERQIAVLGTLQEKLVYFSNRAVLTSAFKHALDTATTLIQHARTLPEPGGLQILATGGCGKTFLKLKLLEAHPISDSLYTLTVPLVAIEMLSTFDEKDLLIEILSQCGERLNKGGLTAQELEDKIVDAFSEVDVRCLFIDEANRLDTITKNARKDDRKLGPIGERLKRIHGRSKVPFILAGTPSLEALLDSDPQYKTRWSAKVRLSPFEFGAEFRGVINALAEALPMRGKTDLSDPVLAKAIWEACDGNFRVLKKLLSAALIAADEGGEDRIQSDHLAQAWRMTGDFGRSNPFEWTA